VWLGAVLSVTIERFRGFSRRTPKEDTVIFVTCP
jgi:hypothetical protein